jgi:hypothetical protein
MDNPGERYERSIAVTTAFFAALIGFGLKRLLDNARDAVTDNSAIYPAEWWALFVMAVLLFLRFLLGAANHMTLEYVRRKKPYPHRRLHFTFDLSALVALGCVAAVICYSRDIPTFLCWNLVYLGIGIGWGWVAAATRKEQREEWNFWVVLDLLVAIPVLIARALTALWIAKPPEHSRWTLVVLIGLVVCYAIALAVDFAAQLAALDKDHSLSSTARGTNTDSNPASGSGS